MPVAPSALTAKHQLRCSAFCCEIYCSSDCLHAHKGVHKLFCSGRKDPVPVNDSPLAVAVAARKDAQNAQARGDNMAILTSAKIGLEAIHVIHMPEDLANSDVAFNLPAEVTLLHKELLVLCAAASLNLGE